MIIGLDMPPVEQTLTWAARSAYDHPMDLLEREVALAGVAEALDEAAGGSGRVVVVAGEAGIGKTALLAAVARTHGAGRLFLGGSCDPLLTPRALGPFHDIARQTGGRLAEALREPGRREELVAAALDELSGSPPRVLMVEDAHWADEGTLDLLALLGRRIGSTTATMVITIRPDEAGDRLRSAMGELPAAVVRRIDLPPLGRQAVAELARRAGREAGRLHGATGGNPFFVTEVLASAGEGVPGSVRDAVLARARRLSPEARRVLEIVGVVPGRAETWLVDALVHDAADAVDECLAAGMLELEQSSLRFRHDIARSSVEQELPPMQRTELDALVLGALRGRPGVDPARLAHHARRAGDREAILEFAPVAARIAGAAGAHLQAAAHFRIALEAAEGRPSGERADLLEGLSVEAYLSGSPDEALGARREALAIRSALGQPERAGENERWLARLLWWAGRRQESEAAAERAIALLEPLGETEALAMAYSTLAQLLMLAWRSEEAVEWGEKAIALARRVDDREALAHALTNVGTARSERGDPAGERQLIEAAELALADGQHDNAVRALVNLAWGYMLRHRHRQAFDMIARGLEFARANDLRSYDQYLLGVRAWARLETGDWPGAEDDARAVLAIDAIQPAISAHPGMVALGRLLVRRGDPGAHELLAETWRRARVADELQRIIPAASACAEGAWLAGDRAAVRRHAERALAAVAGTTADARLAGEAFFWLWRAGGLDEPPPGIPEPYRLSMSGDPRGAAAAWEALGCPYEAADALTDSDDDGDLRRALATFDRLGATLPAARLRARLRDRGGGVPVGPRSATRRDPDGLTPRQREILDLVAQGETNPGIASRLVLSPRTVDHHVSAVLRKLGVATRAEAAALARERMGGPTAAKDGQAGAPV